MEYVNLGPTDLKVSKICLGTMTWGLQNSEADGHAQMDYALEQGVNFFDTAEMYAVPPSAETYGKTETIIGTWFQKRQNRDKVILASKIIGPGPRWVRGGKALIDPDNIKSALTDSLKRLQTDYIDLYQLHWPNRGSYHFGQHWHYNPDPANTDAILDNLAAVLHCLQDQIKAGKIRHIGISNETSWGTMQYLRLAAEQGLPRMVSIQNEYSLLNRLFEPDLAEVALREKIGLLAWSPLATGMLSGKYAAGQMPAGARWNLLKKFNQRDTPAAHAAVDAYAALARQHGLDPAQMALAFVNDRPFVTANIIGATSLEQLKSNIDSIQLKLGADVLKEINAIRRQYPIPF
ncbi:MAG: aldo/keto reductase [Leptospiraceae bacterium]|nr:aldo/keto reductase [Leptospiraceae bacterium]